MILDIETRPFAVYAWQLWDIKHVSDDQIIERGETICVGAKWLGEKATTMFSTWEHGKQAMIEGIHGMMSEASAIITYNGNKFDLPVLKGEFVLAGLKPTAPVPSIDVYQTVKGFKLGKHGLGYVGPLLNLGSKVKHEGFALWRSVMNNDPKAQARMEKYCKQDVVLLEKLYKRILPYIKNHPHLGGQQLGACPSCGSMHVQKRGPYRTRTTQAVRLQCQDCGAWHLGARSKVV